MATELPSRPQARIAVTMPIGGLFLAVLGILAAATSRQLADEFKAWTPWLVDRLIRRAVRQLSENQRERFTEEWHSHVAEVPADVGKLIVAFGFLSASWKMGGSDNHAKLGKQIVEEEPKALPPVGSMSNMPAIFGWMSNGSNADDAVMEAVRFRYQQTAAIARAAGVMSPLPAAGIAATATAVARDLSSPPPAADTTE